MEERLQKYMARCGVDSRRKCEELIARGLVEINGEVVREPGVKIDPARDRIRVDGKPLHAETPAYYIHYKVKGVTTTVSDDLGRKTVMDCLPDIKERVYPVGRLDKESEGLLLLTNDGELANRVTHPAHGMVKTYRVVVEGRVPEEVLRTLGEKGMRLGPVLIRPSQVKLVRYDNDNTVALISVSEGVNREVRRIFAALGHEVKKLLRTRIGPLTLEGMKRGATRPLTRREIDQLRKGMNGADADAAFEEEASAAGPARKRRPAAPRGRARRTASPRQGKPDPAKALRNPPGKGSGKAAGATARAGRGGRGGMVVDDWKKTVSPRKPKAEAAPAPARASKPLRPLRPPSPAKPEPDRPAKSRAPAGRPKTIAHPLASGPAARPASGPTGKPGTRPAVGKPGTRPMAGTSRSAGAKPLPPGSGKRPTGKAGKHPAAKAGKRPTGKKGGGK